jgi:hypothetical protein
MTIRTVQTFVAGCVLALAGFASANAQGTGESSNPLDFNVPKSQVLVGPVVGVNRNFHTGGFRVIDEPNCPVFEQGGGWGFLAGLTAEFQLGKSWSIIPRITYEQRPGSFDQELPDVDVLVPGSLEPVKQTVTTSSEISYNLLTAEVLYKQEFAQIGKGLRIGAAIGPTASYIMGGKINQTQDLVEPENARFSNPEGKPVTNNGRTIIFAEDADIPGVSSTRFSIKAGLQVEFGLFKNAWIMTPGAYYDFGLTDVTGNENWSLSSILFMVDFRRAF